MNEIHPNKTITEGIVIPKEENELEDWDYAGFLLRLVAYMIDGAIVTVPISILMLTIVLLVDPSSLIQAMHYENLSVPEKNYSQDLMLINPELSFLFGLLPTFIIILYGAIFESSSYLATPAKMLLGLKVVNENKQPLIFKEALLRNTLKQLPTFVMSISAVLTAVLVSKFQIEIFNAQIITLVTSLAATIFFIVNIVYCLIDKNTQSLHDNIAETYVIKDPNLTRGLRILGGIILIIVIFVLQSIITVTILMFKLAPIAKTFLDENSEQFFEQLEDEVQDQNEEIEIQEESAKEQDSTLTVVGGDSELTPQERLKQALSKKGELDNTLSQADSKIKEDNPRQTTENIKQENKENGAAILNRKEAAVNPEAPLIEYLRGALLINNKSFKLTKSTASLNANNKRIIINFYASDPENKNNQELPTTPLIIFTLNFNPLGQRCDDNSLSDYNIAIHSELSGINSPDKYITFRRTSNQILSQEYIDFDCLRNENGFIKAELKGTTAFLSSGVRIPIRWQVNVLNKF